MRGSRFMTRPVGGAGEAAGRGVEGGLAEDDPVAEQHVVGVQLVGEDDLDPLAEVSERLPHGVLGAVEDEQHPRRPLPGGSEAEPVEGVEGPAGLGLVDPPVVDDEHPVLGGTVRERAEHRARRTIFFGVRWV